MIGGVDAEGNAEDNFTDLQWAALDSLVSRLKLTHVDAEVLGHRDLSPDADGDGKVERHEWLKECPCFDARAWWISINS